MYSDRYLWNTALYGAASWTLRKVDHKFLKNVKYGAGEGRKRSVGPIVWEKKSYIESGRKGPT